LEYQNNRNGSAHLLLNCMYFGSMESKSYPRKIVVIDFDMMLQNYGQVLKHKIY